MKKTKRNYSRRIKTKKIIHHSDLREYVKTGIEGFDKLLEKGIPKGASVLISGGTGSGKTIMGLQILANAAKKGKKSLYMSFEESEDRLKEHMEDFGWHPEEYAESLY